MTKHKQAVFDHFFDIFTDERLSHKDIDTQRITQLTFALKAKSSR